MNLVRCSKGHFYDGDRYQSCPHCGAGAGADQPTMAMNDGGKEEPGVTIAMAGSGSGQDPENHLGTGDRPTVKKSPRPEENFGTAEAIDLVQRQGTIPDDEGKTISYYSQNITAPVMGEPVTGWLVCTKGKYFGHSFPLKSGRNFIGRGRSMDVALEGEPSVSRDRHAVVIYEPKERMFIAQPGDSRELFYVNDKVVLDNVTLKAYDQLSLGKVNLMLVPCCGKDFAWEDLEKK